MGRRARGGLALGVITRLLGSPWAPGFPHRGQMPSQRPFSSSHATSAGGGPTGRKSNMLLHKGGEGRRVVGQDARPAGLELGMRPFSVKL